MRGLMLLVCVLLVPAGLGMGCHALGGYRLARRSAAWPSVDGIVTLSTTTRMDTAKGWTFESEHIEYEYTVGGRKLRGHRVSYSADWSAGSVIAGLFPRGARVKVHHDPADPEEACLVPGGESLSFSAGITAFGLVLAALGAFGFRSLRRSATGG